MKRKKLNKKGLIEQLEKGQFLSNAGVATWKRLDSAIKGGSGYRQYKYNWSFKILIGIKKVLLSFTWKLQYTN